MRSGSPSTLDHATGVSRARPVENPSRSQLLTPGGSLGRRGATSHHPVPGTPTARGEDRPTADMGVPADASPAFHGFNLFGHTLARAQLVVTHTRD